jgi:protoporphyrinogen/coproporphyrinogen III oxidase
MKTPIGQLDPAIRDVHIWGAGVSGLLIAHFLSKRGFTIHIYEKENRVGGKIHSHNMPEGVVEEGPNAVFATEEILAWLKELGLEVIPARKKLKRRIWNKKITKPISFFGILNLIPRLLRFSPSITDDVSLADFFRPLLKEKVETLLSPALQGVYGCGAEALTVKSIWPHLRSGRYIHVLKQLKGTKAQSVSFKLGMGELIEKLKDSIQGKILYQQSNFVLRPNTIICTDAHTASDFLQSKWPEISNLLSSIEYLPLSSVTALTEPKAEMKNTFGFLFTRKSGIQSLGVLFNKEIFPNRVGSTFITNKIENVDQSIQSDLQKLNWKAQRLHHYSWQKALPIYNARRYKAIRDLHASKQRPSDLVVFGNYVAGISLRDMIQAARAFANNY